MFCPLLCACQFQGQTIEDIPPEVLIDCAQLVKNNSIQGNDQLQLHAKVQNNHLDLIMPQAIILTNNPSSLLHM